MKLEEDLLTVFSAEIDQENGSPVVSVPERELDIGSLEQGETYRVAVLTAPDNSTDSQTVDSTEIHRNQRGNGEKPVSGGDQLEVEIEDIGEKGDGIARVGPGYIVFVSDTEIGDRVTIEVTQARENYAFADVVEGEPVRG